MLIEFRQILEPIKSFKTVRALSLPYKTLLTFDYQPNRKDPEPFIFNGAEILELAGKKNDESFKGYFIGVETDPSNKINYYVFENYQNIIVVNKQTNFKLFDVVPVIR